MMRFTTTVVAVAMLVTPVSTHAADPDAPPGAPADWLPQEGWVMKHWLPYDQATMLRLLRTDRAGLQSSISDERTLWQLAKRRGLDPDRVLRRLVRPWRHRGGGRRLLMLRRARRTFRQPHLAVHMFFHPFHVDALDRQWPRIFGVSVLETYREMNSAHLSYLGVGVRHRGSAELVRRDFRRLLRSVALEGLRRREVLPSESRLALAASRRMMGAWLSYVPPGSNPPTPTQPHTVTPSSAITAVSSLHCRLNDRSAGSATTADSYQPIANSLWTEGLASPP